MKKICNALICLILSAVAFGNETDVVKDVIQLTIADNMIDRGRAVASARRIDSIASVSSETTAAILYSLEADLYNQIYQANRWKYNQRNLPTGEMPEDPTLWDKRMFGEQISMLVWKSLSPSAQLLRAGVGEYSQLLGNMDAVSKEYYPSLYQVLLSRGVDFTGSFMSFGNTIPFRAEMTGMPQGEKIAERIRCYADSAVDYFYSRKEYLPAAASAVVRSKLQSQPVPYLLAWADSCAGTEAEGILLNALANTPYADNQLTAGQFIKRAADYVRRYPASAFTPVLQQNLTSRVRPMVSMTMAERQLVGDSIKMTAMLRKTPDMYMLVYPINRDGKATKLAELVAGRKPVASKRVAASIADTLTITLSPLPKGEYVCVPSRDAGGEKLFEEYMQGSPYQGRFEVGNTVYVSTSSPAGQCALFVADGHEMKPLAGASAVLSSYRKNSEILRLKTDSCGLAVYTDSTHRFTKGEITYGGEKTKFTPAQTYRRDVKVRDVKRLTLFTDRALYRPSDTVRFVGVGYAADMISGAMQPLRDATLKVDMYDAEYQKVDSLSLTTDAHGRITGHFVLPAKGRLGRYTLRERSAGADASFQVAEYKLPTFFVEVDSVQCGSADDKLVFSGRVMTYSGMPLGGADVRYDIECMQSYWRNPMAMFYDSSGATYGAQTLTDADGRFTITLPVAGLKDTPYENALFQLKVAATSQAGETQSAPARMFFSGSTLNISADIPDIIRKDAQPSAYKVKVTDLLGKEVEKEISYKLTEKNIIVAEGTLSAQEFIIPATLSAGRYKVVFSVGNDVSAEREFTLYDPASTVPPVETALWLPQRKVKVSADSEYVKAKALTSYPGAWMMYEVSNGESVLERRVVRAEQNSVEVEWRAPGAGEMLYITFYACHNLEVAEATVTFELEKVDNRLIVSAESFRDKVKSPSTEHWKFKFRKSEGKSGVIPAFATVTNAALDALTPFNWTFSPHIYVPRSMSASNHSYLSTVYASGWLTSYKRKSISLPVVADIFTDGKKLYGGVGDLHIRGRGMVYATAGVVYDSAVTNEMKMAKAESTEEASDEAVATDNEVDVKKEKPLRPAEMPIALFAPLMQSDAEGVLDMDFEVPDYNTTWRVQLIGYDEHLQTAKFDASLEATKPVMVQSRLPRFLRTGDKAEISATMFNALDHEAELEGRIEVCDPKTGNLLREPYTVMAKVPAGGSSVFSMLLDATEISGDYLVKVYASAAGFSDGEQALVALLPSSEPVVEGQTIYMSAADKEYVCRFDDYPTEASVTLNFCSNPVWTVASVLKPLVASGSASILTKADVLFGNALASGLIAKYPQLEDVVTPATSGLEALDEILSLQNADGGWSWCPGMRSSDYITRRVLSVLADMKHLDVLPTAAGCDEAIGRAVGYCDAALIDAQRRLGKNFNALSAMDYLLVRKEAGVAENKETTEIERKAVAEAADEWRNMGIERVASAAMLLEQGGRHAVAKNVLASLRELSVYTPERGRRFENLVGKYTSLYVTMRVLKAFSAVSPSDRETIDQLRQWLLMQKQTEDWSGSGFIPELVYTLLTTGSDWVVDAEPPVVTIGGKRVNTSAALHTGEVTVDFTGKDVSGKELRIIKNSPSPSWGGISSVKVLPIKEVKAAGNEELQIEKRVCRVTVGADGEIVDDGAISVGDKVRVFLTVKAARNIDYVEIKDSRAACLEPVRQISSYTSTDGLWYYLETRDTATNLYIGSLPKGSFIITYDCYATGSGEYASGIANIQSIYAPAFAGHSAGSDVKVGE